MGMFDDFQCEMPLPDGKPPIAFQTKDLDRGMRHYAITKDGVLIERIWESDTKVFRDSDRINHSGAVDFYADDRGVWREYSAWIVNGQVKEIIVLQAEVEIEGGTHTPGPWTVHDEPKREFSNGEVDQGGYRIDAQGVEQLAFVWRCVTSRRPSGAIEAQANAHLIAAAPELLAALKSAREVIVTDLTIARHCQDMMTLAGVRNELQMWTDNVNDIARLKSTLAQIDAALSKAEAGS